MLHKMSVTLNIDDEDKVEFFEITNPSGQKHLFSKFEDGMVVFNHPGMAQSGIWSYHAKLYGSDISVEEEEDEGNQSEGEKRKKVQQKPPKGESVEVDVVSQSNDAEANPFLLEVIKFNYSPQHTTM